MITVRRSEERGHANHGWLDTYHTFSFADYRDPRHMGFRALRVINEDRVKAGKGFGEHPHRDMEIITYVISGALEHRDSMGNGAVIRPGDVQRMSAGTGVTHSEFNPSDKEATHLLQIWILPDATRLEPSYEQQTFTDEEKRGVLRLVASSEGRDGSVSLHQDADLYATVLEEGERVRHDLGSDRGAWIQVVRGVVAVGAIELRQGDGAAVTDQSRLEITARGNAELLLFDLD